MIGTFVLEDAATVLAAMRAATHEIPALVALVALYLGIAVGDVGLYGAGRASTRFVWVRRLLPEQRTAPARDWLRTHLVAAVFTSRFVPGLRLPTYTACGYFGVPFGRFVLYVVAATIVWTSLLFAVSLSLGGIIMHYMGAWRWAGAIGLAVAVVVTGRIVSRSLPAHQ